MAVTSGEGAMTKVVIHGTDTLQDFEAVVHMRGAAFVDSLGTAFCGGTWKGRAADLRTVLCYSETVLAKMLTAVWKVEAFDSLSMHWHFVGTEMLSSWGALLRTNRAAFLAAWTTLLRTIGTKCLVVMYTPILNKHVRVFGSDLIAVVCDENWAFMKETWAALIADNNESVVALFAHDFGIVIHSVKVGCCTLSLKELYQLTLDLVKSAHLMVDRKVAWHPTLKIGEANDDVETCHGDGHLTWGILEGCQTTLGLQEPYSPTLSILRSDHPTLRIREDVSPTLRIGEARFGVGRCLGEVQPTFGLGRAMHAMLDKWEHKHPTLSVQEVYHATLGSWEAHHPMLSMLEVGGPMLALRRVGGPMLAMQEIGSLASAILGVCLPMVGYEEASRATLWSMEAWFVMFLFAIIMSCIYL